MADKPTAADLILDGMPENYDAAMNRVNHHQVQNPANYVQETYDKMARRNACLDGKHEVEMAVDVSADFYERGNHDRKRDIFVCTHCRNLYVPRT